METKSQSKCQQYNILDNGGTPFKVIIKDGNVKVYIATYEGYASPILTIDPQQIFIGNHKPYYDGNSILLKVDTSEHIYKYIFIGWKIYLFTTEYEIMSYSSPVGNSCAPYPYAVDTKNNYYLLILDVVVSNVPDGEDPYNYYFQKNLITPDLAYVNQKYMPPYKDIVMWYVDKEHYTFRYTPIPYKEYSRMTDNIKKMYVVKTDGKKYILTKKEYVELMKSVGDERGFFPINIIELLQDRL